MSTVKRKFGLIVAMVIVMGLIILPANIKAMLPDSGVKDWLQNRKVRLGLDLQGGTQLDFRIDLSQAEAYNNDDDPNNDVFMPQLIEGVRNTIERRVNGLGVEEAVIQLSQVANEQHIIVELPGVKDLDEAKKSVGKTIQLEFKEQADELSDVDDDKIRAQAQTIFDQLVEEKADFDQIAEFASTGSNRVFSLNLDQFKDELYPIFEPVWETGSGSVYSEVIEGDLNGIPGLAIVKSGGKDTVSRDKQEPGEDFMLVAKSVTDLKASIDLGLKTKEELTENSVIENIWEMSSGEVSDILERDDYFEVYKLEKVEDNSKVQARHILISFSGAQGSDPSVTRSKEEALKLAIEAKGKIDEDLTQFDIVAVEYSDDPTVEENKGNLGAFARGEMVLPFDQAAFALDVGKVSNPIESVFGYHIIYKYGEDIIPVKKQFLRMSVSKADVNARSRIETGKNRLEVKTITSQEEQVSLSIVFVSLQPDGWKETGLDGRYFKRAVVARNDANQAYVAIEFNDEGGKLFEEITERNVEKPLAIFVGGNLVSAPRVSSKISGGSAQISGNFTYKEAVELKNDLNAGAIPAPIYLVGQYQIGATLGEASLQKSLMAGLAGLIVVLLYMILYYRFLGLLAAFALIIYAVIMMFVLQTASLVQIPITLTLAGIAGLILSIGMAVDANILIFERFKEEIKDGKNFSAAVRIGFDRAWTSIRDSNVSTIITCFVLAWFGSSIIRGFAIMLGIGVLISMFTAIVVTRTFLILIQRTSVAKKGWLFGVKKIIE